MAGCIKDRDVWEKAYADKKQIIADLQPDLTQDQVNKIAFKTFLHLYRQDWRAAQEEEKNLPETSGPKFSLTAEGRVYYPQYGGATLNGLHLTQKRLMPDQYSATDHQTSIAIDTAFQNGATTVVTSYARPGMDNRDLIVMTYDPNTGVGQTKIINTAVDRNYHSFIRIKEIAKSNFESLHETNLNKSIFILTDKPISEIIIHQAVSRTAPDFVTPINRTITYQVTDQMINTTGRIVGDIRITAGTVIEYLKKRSAEKINKTQTSEPNGIQIKNQIPGFQEIYLNTAHKLDVTKDKLITLTKKELFNLIRLIIPIKFMGEFGVGIGAASIFLKRISEIRKTIDSKEKKDIKSSEKNVIKKLPKQFRLNLPPKWESMKQVKIEEIDGKVISLDKIIYSGKAKEIKIREQPLKKLIKFFQHITWRINQMEKASVKHKQKPAILANKDHRTKFKLENQTKEKILIFKFTQIYILWLMFNLFDRQTENESKLTKKQIINENETENISSNIPRVYLLAAIIWYLAQIREQSFYRQSSKKKKQNKQISQCGLIYQFTYS